MILRFRTPAGEYTLNVNTSKECYNFGTTPDRNYITVSKKDYSRILEELDFNCFDYSEDLGTGDPADRHAFIDGDLNVMCRDCKHLYILCDGSHNKLYSGCIWKDADAKDLETFTRATADATKGATP